MTQKRRILKTRLLSGYLLVILWLSAIIKVLAFVGLTIGLILMSYLKDNSLVSESSRTAQKSYTSEWNRFFFWIIILHVAVLVTVWFYRTYKNLQTLGVRTRYMPLWAPFSFFIWGINLFMPYQIMQEIWTKIQQVGLDKEKAKYIPRSSSLVVVWWVAWVLFVAIILIAYLPPWLGVKLHLGLGSIFVVPVVLHNTYVLSAILDITLLALITQIRWHEKQAFKRLRARKKAQIDKTNTV